MVDVFRECRERVSAQDAARHYGLTFDRKGWAVCPFHSDKHPSMSFKNGWFRCWACNVSGDSIDFTGKLLGLEPLAAVERLDADFCLNLPLHKTLTPAERKESARAAQHRQEIDNTYQAFQVWRDGFINQLNACFRLAHLTMKGIEAPEDFDRLTDQQIIAIQQQPYIEYLADILTSGEMSEIMGVFRERGAIQLRIDRILNHSPMKSGAA